MIYAILAIAVCAIVLALRASRARAGGKLKGKAPGQPAQNGRGTLHPTPFTNAFAAFLRQQMRSAKITVLEPLSLSIEHEGKTQHCSLQNAYELYQHNPGDIGSIFESFGASVFTADDDAPINPAHILPSIKAVDWLDGVREQSRQIELSGGGVDSEPLYEQWLDGLLVVYAENRPFNVRFPDAADLAKLGIPRSELRSRAVDNLRSMVEGNVRIEKRFQGAPNLRITCSDSVWDSSLLLLDSLWCTDKLGISGDIVAAIPARDLLLVADGASPESMEYIRRGTGAAFNMTPYSLSSRLLIRRNGQWEYLDR